MSNPFDLLKTPASPKKEDLSYDEWGGQFSCHVHACNGWATVARYYPSVKALTWECQEGHLSRITDIDE